MDGKRGQGREKLRGTRGNRIEGKVENENAKRNKADRQTDRQTGRESWRQKYSIGELIG